MIEHMNDREWATWIVSTLAGVVVALLIGMEMCNKTEVAVAQAYAEAAVEVAKVIMGGF